MTEFFIQSFLINIIKKGKHRHINESLCIIKDKT